MATLKTNIALLQSPVGGGNESKRAPGVFVTGDIGMLIATYTTVGTETAADFIEIGTMPEGTRIVPHLSKVITDAAPAAALVGTIGDGADPDRYSTAITATAGGQFDLAGSADGAVVPFLNTVNTPILFDPTTWTTPGAGKRITFYLAFTSQN